ncbi:D-proline reductase (dithiol) proprotein PrdA [Spiroplasma alleghenense]|uniref:D-proline reductase (Dithiol) PrdA n=1 Tax=Spiroplasma alleghenense TaxID=216931 RepID=A0A345Z2P6_9MOLU|nr:D-proline reductase (dithiol) proprotein PrdA [Spiroplasma alleghenense]AXK50875.1 D-proline reductase (dithiol) PrdA [Spiroplasma alleghenense]
MSMDKEKALKLKDKKAFTCCRFEAGSTIDASILEDPALLPDFVDSGLISVSDDMLTIGQVLGAKLKVTVDALTPLTPANVENYSSVEEAPSTATQTVAQSSDQPTKYIAPTNSVNDGMVRINIGLGTNINIEFPMGSASGNVSGIDNIVKNMSESNNSNPVSGNKTCEPKVLRTLKKEYVNIKEVKIGKAFELKDGILTIDKGITQKCLAKGDLVTKFDFEIITQKDYSKDSDTIMDVQPIAAKIEDELGSGVTRVLDNVVIVLTGVDENGKQIGEFGSSEGPLDRNIMWNRPGAPDFGDIFIKINTVIKANAGMERPGPLAAHLAADVLTQEIRKVLTEAKGLTVVKTENLEHKRNFGKPKVVVVKEIMGQGAMHDNLILPTEPVGTIGGVPNVDLGNLPIAISPLELLDGGVHALTCIGPASKETSRHYFREPLVAQALVDEEIDFVGLILVGSPQVNGEKFYVSKRLGMMVEYMGVDAAIITTEGFGNNHIDFASHHEEIGKRGVKVVGCTYAAQQGALVVGNQYMVAMVDNNKSKQGIENEILSNNTLCHEDAIRALEMIKAQIDGTEIQEAERKWDPNIKQNNIDQIKSQANLNFELVKNEQVLEKSRKRAEIYEKE